MNFVDEILNTHKSFFIYECDIYAPKFTGLHGSTEGISLEKIGKIEDEKHKLDGNFSNAKQFLQNAVIPLISMNTLEDKFARNCGFDNLWPSYFPIGVGKKNYHLYTLDSQGELQIKQKKFRKVKQIYRNCADLKQKNYNARGVELEGIGPDYSLSQKLNPFFMKGEDGGRYFFSNIWITMDIKERGNLLKISTPRAREHYHHPFIHEDKQICFKNDKRWDTRNIDFKTRNIDGKLLRDINTAFNEAKKNLIGGYQKGVHPVHTLNQSLFKKEYQGAI